jgi:predicted MFS family arabinose efflux permease
MRGLEADSGWTRLILGMAVAGAGSGMVTPALASTPVRVVQPEEAGMASGVNSTFRQIGIAVSVAVLGGIFDASIGGAATATLTARYAAALDDV